MRRLILFLTATMLVHVGAETVRVVGEPSLDGAAGVRAARQIAAWQPPRGRIVTTGDADWVVHLSESYDYHSMIPDSHGSSIVYNGARGRALAETMARAVNATVDDVSHAFVAVQHSTDAGDLPFALAENELLVLTTARTERPARRIRVHRVAVEVLLRELGMIEKPMRYTMTPAALDESIRIAVYDDDGSVSSSGHSPEWIVRSMAHLSGFNVQLIDAEDIRGGALAGFEVILMGGGNASEQGGSLGEQGRERVRAFISKGGGYVGICAGGYLAMEGEKEHLLRICDVKSKSPAYGTSIVEIELATPACRLLDTEKTMRECKYSGGPIFMRAGSDELPDYTVLAWFRSEPPKTKQKPGGMAGTPAVVASRYGKGRVVVYSFHPERYPGPRELLYRSIEWAAGRGDINLAP